MPWFLDCIVPFFPSPLWGLVVSHAFVTSRLSLLPRYRSLTKVLVGDGQLTSFWHDKWLLSTPLADTFPVLFSHCVDTNGSVCSVMSGDLQHHLRPRLTRAADDDLASLRNCLQVVTLRPKGDCRPLNDRAGSAFSLRMAYSLAHPC